MESSRRLWNRVCKFLTGGDRWLALVAGMWIMSCAGSSYTFAIYSPVLKSRLGYNQVQIQSLAVAKDVGESVGLLAGLTCDLLPPWGMLLIGALHNVVGFGSLWLVLSGYLGPRPYWQLCTILVIGSQGTSYLNTANLVTSVRNFPRSRGIVVGVLKGLVGLSGAIFTQLYTALLAPNQKDFVLLVAVYPLLVTLSTMIVVRPVGGRDRKETDEEEGCLLSIIVTICFFLAAYLFAAMLAQDLLPVSRQVSMAMTAGMVGIFLLPLVAPIRSRLVARHKRHLAAAAAAAESASDADVSHGDGRPKLEEPTNAQSEESLKAPLLSLPSVQKESLAALGTSGPIRGPGLLQPEAGADKDETAHTGKGDEKAAAGDARTTDGISSAAELAGGDKSTGSRHEPVPAWEVREAKTSQAPVLDPTSPAGRIGPQQPRKPPLPPTARQTIAASTSTRRPHLPLAANPNLNPNPRPYPTPYFLNGNSSHPTLSANPSLAPDGAGLSSSGYFSDDLFSGDEEERGEPSPLLGGLSSPYRRKESHLLQAVGEGAVKVKRRKGPRRGEDFTLAQAVVKADFWLLFLAMTCGCGSGLAAINNLAQMGLAQGYQNVRIFVAMVSVWNFCGRIGAGFLSEHIVKTHALPRPYVLLGAQACMAVGHLLFALALPGSLYVGSLIVGLCYGAHWAIMPATASELFGLKHFGMLYNTLTIANPLGSFLFSGLIAAYLYDREAERQGRGGVTGGFYGGVGTGLGLGFGSGGPWGVLGWAGGCIRESLLGREAAHPLDAVGRAGTTWTSPGASGQLPSNGSQLAGSDGITGTNGLLWFLNTANASMPHGTLQLAGAVDGAEVMGGYRGRALLGPSAVTQSSSSAVLPSLTSSQGGDCYGAHCFRLTFFIMMGVCLVGVVLNAVLIVRTKPVYFSLYNKQMEAKRQASVQDGTPPQESRSS